MQQAMNHMYHLASQAKNVHWNITGRGFRGIHELCDEIDEEFREMGDRIAERMRFLEENPEIMHNSQFQTITLSDNGSRMVNQLISVLERQNELCDEARNGMDSVCNSILDDAQELCGKYLYFLRSYEF